ncbi:MAG TPA: hypothetical protein VGF43_22895 [Dongiaceae bacterium]
MTAIALRPPDVVMRLARLGASHPTRLSFLRSLMRRAARERWTVHRTVWDFGDEGFGRGVYAIEMPGRRYSLVALSTPLEPWRRTDRVIAQAWDTSYVLYDGVPDASEIARLEANVPLQEAGRFTARDLILARANKSVRLFEAVVEALARGVQPDAEALRSVGYLMRTTAVYGNGKFGIADRDEIAGRPELSGPFQAEMLTVWLIRSFTIDLADHIALRRNPDGAARLDPPLRRALGVGNATGLGMAPFLVRHPVLVHRWFHARETALARVRSLPSAGTRERAEFGRALEVLRDRVGNWRTVDPRQSEAIRILAEDIAALARVWEEKLDSAPHPWDALYRFAEQRLSLEGQEACVALLLEPHGALVDELAETMAADESVDVAVDGRMSCGALKTLVDGQYAWARGFDFRQASSNARFWYISAEKLEPRLGERFEEDGGELEQPLAIARDAMALSDALTRENAETPLADFLLRRPEWRHVARRAQILAKHPYAEIRDNLIDASMRPVDLLRSKLAFFGARNFDPRSDRWVRIALFAGEPLAEEIGGAKDYGVAA